MKQLGIDEAGRGPVIGPMVIAGAVIDKDGEERLRNLGVKDSKMIAPARREFLFLQIKEIALSYKITILSNHEIDDALNSPSNNLNKFEMVNMAMITNSVDCEEVILDCPTVSLDKFANEFRVFLKDKNKKVVAENKADAKYISVAAASILAKVTRDREVEKIKIKHNIEFGSGYPSDPRTIAFIKDNFRKYDFFRKTWSTWKKLDKANHNKQVTLGDF